MVSLIACFLNSIGKLIPKPHSYHTHAFGLPLPQAFHRSVDPAWLEEFEEILVIGDVHGCYDELKLLLKKANAEEDSVLKIFVGDLVNKGPKSKEVLNLLMNSTSMVSVRGNHDEVVLREYFESKNPNYKLSPENAWINDLRMDEVRYLVELPYTISLPSLNTIIVHAGLLPGMPLESNDIMDMVVMRNIIVSDYFWDGGLLATKNPKEGEPWASLWRGPQHVYFGHDAKRMLQCYSHATGLDTGCVYGNWLTGVFIKGKRKGEFVKQDALKTHKKTKSKD
ncbi:bis(5'-nucleosyl)-tetraphosphatase PrpE [asymmetrical] [Parasteatoda tepidariorum]|uniref:bis(5'-nucleosyl)-tetraphosphatase PrpE [asymmetrical] n=1 Tax=Parasteatoda tepidariorum TaxID=114398 RepID=UPI00077F94D2|nr:bis(5'-nucleosyl)-tetraphosphatase PrpE [asymmetrical] [Parasteatoda tepidariorum]